MNGNITDTKLTTSPPPLNVESNNEIKAFQQQKDEAERHQELLEKRSELVVRLLLWKLFHTEKDTEKHRESVKELEKNIDDKEGRLVSHHPASPSSSLLHPLHNATLYFVRAF